MAAEVSLSEAIPSGVEEQREEEKEDNAPLVSTRGLCSRGPAFLEEGELADEPLTIDEAEQLEADLVSRADVEIPGVSIQPGSSSASERREEAQQPGSPSVLIPSPRVVDPSPTTGVFGGKAPIAEASRVELLSSSSGEDRYDSGDEVDFGDELAPLDPSKFSHISEEEIYGCDPVTASPPAAVASAEGTLSTVLLI